MGKDLFSDLNSDVSDKYKNKNDATIIANLTESVDAWVNNLSKESRTHLWAEVVIETYESLYNENKDIIEDVSSYKKLYALKKEAEKFLSDEIKAIEQSKNLKAKEVDDKIKILLNATKGKFWCDDVDILIKEVDGLNKEIRSRCKKLDEIENLKQIKDKVLRAIKIDDELVKLDKERTESIAWCKKVNECFYIVFNDKLEPFITKNGLLTSLLVESEKTSQAIEAKKRKQAEIDELKRQQKALEEAKLKAELHEKELRQEYERKLNEERERAQKIKKQADANLQKVLNANKNKFLEFAVIESNVYVSKCTNVNLKKIEIPDGVYGIGEYAFSDMKKLAKIKFSDSVEQINKGAFKSCEKLKQVEFNDNLRSILNDAFAGCKSLKVVSIGKSLSKISGTAFIDCPKLKEFKINSSNYTFCTYRGNLYSADKKALYRTCPAKKEKNVLMLINVDYVHDYAYQGCNYMQSVDTNTVSVLGDCVFDGCKNLKKFNARTYLKVIGLSTFKKCKKLSNIKTAGVVYTKGSVDGQFTDCKRLPKKYKAWVQTVDYKKQSYVDNVVSKYKKYM